jgi:hypothetical protein
MCMPVIDLEVVPTSNSHQTPVSAATRLPSPLQYQLLKAKVQRNVSPRSRGPEGVSVGAERQWLVLPSLFHRYPESA